MLLIRISTQVTSRQSALRVCPLGGPCLWGGLREGRGTEGARARVRVCADPLVASPMIGRLPGDYLEQELQKSPRGCPQGLSREATSADEDEGPLEGFWGGLRPISVLSFRISEGLTRAES